VSQWLLRLAVAVLWMAFWSWIIWQMAVPPNGWDALIKGALVGSSTILLMLMV